MRTPLRTRRRTAFVILVLAGTLVTACSGSDDQGAATTTGASTTTTTRAFEAQEHMAADGDFSTPPDPLPEAEHGTLLRYDALDSDLEGGSAWRVMYLSESVDGTPTAVTGTVAVPNGTPPPEGWKLLSLAHGTTGIGDQCAPSSDESGLYLGLASSYLARGYVVALSDYEGLGTPGIHPYFVGESEGRGVIDAARAARQMPDVEIGDRFAIWGYSQGGHAALWANQIASTWAPELSLVGTVAGAGPGDMADFFSDLRNESLPPDYFFMMVAGYAQAYPDLDPADILTPAGLDVLAKAGDSCYGLGLDTGGRSMAELVTTDETALRPWLARMSENDPGNEPAPSPVLILHSAADDMIPVKPSERLLRRMCDVGQVVERRVYDKGHGHIEATGDALADGEAWIHELMDETTDPLSIC